MHNPTKELLELKGTLTGPVDGLEATLTKAEEDLKENEALVLGRGRAHGGAGWCDAV
jgi:hypothetical protein